MHISSPRIGRERKDVDLGLIFFFCLFQADSDNNILIWDLRKAQDVAHLTGHTAKITSLDFCSNGKILASGSLDGTVRLWDTGALRVGECHNCC